MQGGSTPLVADVGVFSRSDLSSGVGTLFTVLARARGVCRERSGMAYVSPEA